MAHRVKSCLACRLVSKEGMNKNMKSKFISSILVLLMAASSIAEAPATRSGTRSASALDTDSYIDANRILMIVTNNGSFAYDIGSTLGKSDGLYFPYSRIDYILSGADRRSVVFASGIWLGAIDSATSERRIAVAEYSMEYFPGPMVAGTFDAAGLSNPAYRVYKLYRDSLASNPNQDYLEWPADQGAPLDSTGAPAMVGDQMTWTVFNDANPARHTNDAGLTPPLGVEVQTTAFAFDRQGSLGNIVFMRFKISNKGSNVLTNMYVSLWADPDLGGAGDDLVGSDSLLSLGYCYNADNDDAAYGAAPPAVGYDFFQGPLDSTGNLADTAIMWGQIYPGNRNLPMSSFNKYINGTDPHTDLETYNYMQGLNKDGTPYVFGGDTLTFFHSGDPVAGTGDIDANPADRRYMLTTGPFTFRPGDSTEVVAAIIAAQGSDRLTSITRLKEIDKRAQQIYDNFFQTAQPCQAPEVTVARVPNRVAFSWTDTSEVVPGDYPFIGYLVSQGPDADGPWTQVAISDIQDTVLRLLDTQVVQTGTIADTVAIVLRQLPNEGIERTFSTTTDVLTGEPIRNLRTYFFKVEGFTYSGGTLTDTVEFGDKLLGCETVFEVIPQNPPANFGQSLFFADTIPIDTANSDIFSEGQVLPLVVNPLELTGDTYKVFFGFDTTVVGIDTTIQKVYFVVNETTGDTVLANQSNFTGDEDYLVFDGLMLKVTDPEPGYKLFEVVANASGALNPPEGGAFDFGEFPSARPTDAQQVGAGLWGIHTADNGGSEDGGTRALFPAFVSRTTRDGGNLPAIGGDDYEIRFTGDISTPGVNGSYAWNAFTDGATMWVPFELWNIGPGTLTDASDDYRMVPWINDVAGDTAFTLESYGSSASGGAGGFEHSVSGGNNDPYTDWIYWYDPTDKTPGEVGYLLSEAELIAGTYDGSREVEEVFARMVLVNWNGGAAPPFNQDMPEMGTIFRIHTAKPATLADTFRFVASAPAAVTANAGLNNVRAVPNPYYLASEYDTDSYNRVMRFSNLPTECTISIFTLSGDLVRKLSKNSPESYFNWDIENQDGIPLASGIYVFVVEAPGMGHKIGKLALFTEREQLQQY